MTHRRPGVQLLGNGSPRATSDAAVEWREAIEEKMRAGKSKPEAVRELAIERPDLHRRFVREHNASVGPSSYRGSTLD